MKTKAKKAPKNKKKYIKSKKHTKKIIKFCIANLKKYLKKYSSDDPLVKHLINDLKQAKSVDEILKKINHAYALNSQCGDRYLRLTELLISMKYEIVELDKRVRLGISSIYRDSADEPVISASVKSKKVDWLKHLLQLPNAYDKHIKTYGHNGIPDDCLDGLQGISIVYVSGGPGNRNGHALLKLDFADDEDSKRTSFLHINTLVGYPQHIESISLLRQYLAGESSKVIRIRSFSDIDIEKAKEVIKQVTQHHWSWRISRNNCLSFAESVLIKCGVSAAELRPYAIGHYHADLSLPMTELRNLEENLAPFQDSVVHRKVVDKLAKDACKEYKEKAERHYGMDSETAKIFADMVVHQGMYEHRASLKCKKNLSTFHRKIAEGFCRRVDDGAKNINLALVVSKDTLSHKFFHHSRPLVTHGFFSESYQRLISEEQIKNTPVEDESVNIVQIEGDGNCLFRAVARAMGAGYDHIELRKATVDYMQEHRDDFEPFIQEDQTQDDSDPFDSHISRMSLNGTWGGELELRALKELLNRTIIVTDESNGQTYPYGAPETDDEPICLLYNGSTHYNLRLNRPIQEEIEEQQNCLSR